MKTYLPVAPGTHRSFSHTRPVYVVDSLTQLGGPSSGIVHLPITLDWTPASSYDLSSASRLRSMYATVLREAGSEADLIEWLDCRLLLQHWSELNLPAFTRSSWESKHPELRGRASWR